MSAFAIRFVEDDVISLRQSALYSLLAVRLRHFWQPDAVGVVARCADARTVMIPMGSALIGIPGRPLLDTPVSSLLCVAWGFVDASVRIVSLGASEGSSGQSRVRLVHDCVSLISVLLCDECVPCVVQCFRRLSRHLKVCIKGL